MMTHPPERGRGRGGGRGRGRGRTNARPGWSDKGPSFDRGTDFREPSRFQHDAQQPARFWRKKVDLNADPNAFYDQIHRTGSADRQHSSRDGRTSQPSDWGRAGRNGPVFEPVDTAGRFVPDLDGSDAKSGGFIPDNSENSEPRSWIDRRKADVVQSRGSLDIAFSDLDRFSTDEEVETFNIANLDISTPTPVPDALPVGSDLTDISWSAKYSDMPDLSYWAVHLQFPAMHPKNRLRDDTRPSETTTTSRAGDDKRTMPHTLASVNTCELSEAAAAADFKRTVTLLEKSGIHLDPPEMTFFKLTPESRTEINSLFRSKPSPKSSPARPNQRPHGQSGQQIKMPAASDSLERVDRVLRMVSHRSEAMIKQFLLPIIVPSLGHLSLDLDFATPLFPLLAEGFDTRWSRYKPLVKVDGYVPCPSYTVGFSQLAFPPKALATLIKIENLARPPPASLSSSSSSPQPGASNPTTTRPGVASSPQTVPPSPIPGIGCCNSTTTDQAIFFPFFCADVSSFPWSSPSPSSSSSSSCNRADAKCASAMAHPAAAICHLFDLVGQTGALTGQVLGFSVHVTGDGAVTVCAHYPIIVSGSKPAFCRTRIRDFKPVRIDDGVGTGPNPAPALGHNHVTGLSSLSTSTSTWSLDRAVAVAAAADSVRHFFLAVCADWAPRLLSRIVGVLDTLADLPEERIGGGGGGGKFGAPPMKLKRSVVEGYFM